MLVHMLQLGEIQRLHTCVENVEKESLVSISESAHAPFVELAPTVGLVPSRCSLAITEENKFKKLGPLAGELVSYGVRLQLY